MHIALQDALFSPPHWIAVLATLVTVSGAFMIHYAILSWLSGNIRRIVKRRRPRVLFTVGMALLGHIAQIWLFGVAYAAMLQFPAMGYLSQLPDPGLLDCVYFSATIFTTLGFGDLTPRGPISFLVGMESLSGFMLITWSASFTYLEMHRNWE